MPLPSKYWRHNDIREAQLLALARRDMEHYQFILRIGDRMLERSTVQPPDVFTTQLYNEIVRTALATYDEECTVAELTYASLRTRGRMTHSRAVAAAGLTGRANEDLVLARKPVRDAIARERDKMAEEARITKDDVVQGLLNAVACADSSQDLTKAWREIGLLMGYYEETKVSIKQHVEKTVTHRIEGVDLRMLSDEALMKHAGAELLEKIKPAQPRVIEHKPAEVIEVPIELAEPDLHPRADDRHTDERRALVRPTGTPDGGEKN